MAPRRVARAPKRAIKRVKYSNETFSNCISVTAPGSSDEQLCNNYWIPVITSSSVAGMRKAKNFSITLTCIPPTLSSNTAIYDIPVIVSAMLIYLPEGTKPMAPDYSALPEPEYPTPAPLTNVYKPEQNIIMSKLGNITTSGSITMRNRLARNLNSGDSVGILLSVFSLPLENASQFPIVVSANYAVSY